MDFVNLNFFQCFPKWLIQLQTFFLRFKSPCPLPPSFYLSVRFGSLSFFLVNPPYPASQILTLSHICVYVLYPLASIFSACGHKYCLDVIPLMGPVFSAEMAHCLTKVLLLQGNIAQVTNYTRVLCANRLM